MPMASPTLALLGDMGIPSSRTLRYPKPRADAFISPALLHFSGI